MTMMEVFTLLFVGAGAVLFLAGTLGLLRFPDPLSRLHALSKADNLGLGLIVVGLMPYAEGVSGSLKLVCVWLLAQLSAAAAWCRCMSGCRWPIRPRPYPPRPC